MKLVRYGAKGLERPGALDSEGRLRDLSKHMVDFGGETVRISALEPLKALDLESLPLVEGTPRIGPCLIDMPNFYCVGLNYGRHAEVNGVTAPSEPVLFSKATSSLAGPNDPIVLPHGSTMTDWEVELGVVIGKEASRIDEEHALDHIAGYCLVNDLSERALQAEGNAGQWFKGKSAPSFGKIGPWLVTADEIANPQQVSLWLELNGERMQQSSTVDMIFPVAEIVSHLSWHVDLRVGDVIATGTPEGIGMHNQPPRYLRPGDVVQCGGGGLGEQRAVVVPNPLDAKDKARMKASSTKE